METYGCRQHDKILQQTKTDRSQGPWKEYFEAGTGNEMSDS